MFARARKYRYCSQEDLIVQHGESSSEAVEGIKKSSIKDGRSSAIGKAGGFMSFIDRTSTRNGGSARALILGLVLCLLPYEVSLAGQVVISSLPYTVTTSDNNDTLRLASSYMSTGGRAITFTNDVHDVYIDLGADTLVWGTAGNSDTYGIWLPASNVRNITIDGGFILHNPPQWALDPNNILRARAVRLDNAHDVVIKDAYFSVYGRNSQIMYSEGSCYNVEISGCTFYDGMEAFTQRDMWIDNAMLALGNNNSISWPGFQYHFKIHDCTTENAHWVNCYVHGDRLVAEICDNFFISDARNDYDTQGPIYGTAAQCYAVSIRGGDGGSRVKVHDNIIRSGDSYAGGRGIFVAAIDGISMDPDSSINIYNNDIRVHQGYDGEERTLNGIIVRQCWKNVNIIDNTIVCIGDTSSATPTYDRGPICGIRLTTGCDGNERGLRIVGNVIRTYITGGFVPDYGDLGTYAAGIIFDQFSMNVPDVVIDSNLFESNSLCIRWGFYNGHGGNVTMRNNAFSHYNSEGAWVFYLGYGSGGSHNAYDNWIIDGQYLNGAQDTDIYVWDGEPDSLSIGLQKTLRLQVLGNNDLPVPGATVRFVNAYGETVGQGQTNSNGRYSSVVSYWWECNAAFNQGDSTSFNNFSIEASKNGDSSGASYHLTWDSQSPTLILQNTEGQQGGDDIPPEPINDLQITPGNNHGEMVLTWTAPGDDGDSGTASYYVIKYSTEPITQYNFSAAQTAPNPPVPQPAGQTENFTISGLVPGQSYYAAVKSYDEVDNESGISNVPQGFAAGILIPLPLGTEIDENQMSVDLSVLQIESYFSVSYEFDLDTVITFPNPLVDYGVLTDTVASVTFTDLSVDYTYYWRSRAMAANHSDSSDWTVPISFNVLTGTTEGLSENDCIFPAEGEMIGTPNPVFQVRYVDGITHIYFRVDDDPQFATPVESGPVPTSSGQVTSWQFPNNIIAGISYYWQISADNQVWTAPVNFGAILDVHAYPNPVRFSAGNTEITFTNLSVRSDITIATASGDIVFEADGVGPGEWAWNLRNKKGKQIASGVYLYHVDSPSGPQRGKLMVIR